MVFGGDYMANKKSKNNNIWVALIIIIIIIINNSHLAMPESRGLSWQCPNPAVSVGNARIPRSHLAPTESRGFWKPQDSKRGNPNKRQEIWKFWFFSFFSCGFQIPQEERYGFGVGKDFHPKKYGPKKSFLSQKARDLSCGILIPQDFLGWLKEPQLSMVLAVSVLAGLQSCGFLNMYLSSPWSRVLVS